MGGNESKNPQLVGVTYSWKVEKFLGISLLEPKFSADFEVFEDSYRLGLHKNRNTDIKLHQKKESDDVKKFRCISALLDTRGIQRYSQTKEVAIGKGTNNVLLLSIPQLLLVEELSDVVSMNSFYVSLKISPVSDTPELSALDVNSTEETLSSDLRKFYCNQTDCDVEITTNTDCHFKAHRLILSARAPVFEAMFRHDTAERAKGVINIPDVDEPILASLLLYIYTRKVRDLNSNTAARLVAVADKYDLQDLKDTCLGLLLNTLTMDNICDAVVLAEMCGISTLRKEVHDFISRNTAEVIQSDKWEELQNDYPDIVNATLAALLISEKSKVK